MRTVAHDVLLPQVHLYFRMGSGAALVISLFALGAVASTLGTLATCVAFGIWLVCAAACAVILRARAKVVLGDDGLAVVSFGRGRFIPLADIQLIDSETAMDSVAQPNRVVVGTSTGEVSLLFPRRSNAARFIQQLRATSRWVADTAVVPLPGWDSGQVQAPYRSAASSLERLLAALACPRQKPHLRARAAWRIANEHPAHMQLVARAADGAAHPVLRRFLRLTAQGRMLPARRLLRVLERAAERVDARSEGEVAYREARG